MKRPIVIIGCGGFAREVYSWFHNSQWVQFMGFYSDDVSQHSVLNLPVFHSLKDSKHWEYIVAVGDPRVRKALAEKADLYGLVPCLPLIHKSCTLGLDSSIGRGSVLCPNVVLSTGVHIGEHVILNLSATVGHDSQIGEFTTVSPGANISGNVKIGPYAYLGTNASIREGKTLGPGAVCGMGTAVVKDVAEGVTIIGQAARPLVRDRK